MKTNKIFKNVLILAFVLFAGAALGNTVNEPLLGMAVALTASLVAGAAKVQFGGVALNLITGTPITFNGKEATEGLIEPAYETPEITEFMTIVENIVAKEQIAFLGRLSKLTKLNAGCGSSPNNKTIPLTEKFWNPVAVEAWLTQCETDLENTFFVWGAKKGIDREDLTGTDFANYVLDIMTQAMREDALRFLWFGDTAADEITNGSFLNAAADIPYYNTIDGFWKQIFTAVTGNTTTRITITENAGVNYAAQVLPAGAAYAYLLAMVEQADPRLAAADGAFIGMTQSMYNNWLATKESKSFDSSFARQDKAFKQDIFRGYPIYVMNFWDRNINADMNNGTKRISPHRAIMTTKENLLVGFDESGSVTKVDAWFNKETKINHMRGGYKIDAKMAYDFMTIAAY